ncbi:MAG: SIMPL domain-containing protein [Chloroflexi bacterium]|nr:SIMPL domain-containing protein [Chloroflexota bacterium]
MTNLKTTLGITAAAIIGLVALVVAACGGADANDSSGVSGLAATGESTLVESVSVSGSGSVFVDPDVALLSLGVSLREDTAQEARDRVASLTDKLVGSLKDHGIDENDIQTTTFNLHAEYDYRNDERRLLGYRITHTLLVTVRDLDRVGEVLDDAVAEVGDTLEINGISFAVDEPDQFLSEARADAMAQAKAKAKELAELGERELGKAILISEGTVSPPPVFYDASYSPLAAAELTSIQTGQLELSVNVQVTYEMV